MNYIISFSYSGGPLQLCQAWTRGTSQSLVKVSFVRDFVTELLMVCCFYLSPSVLYLRKVFCADKKTRICKFFCFVLCIHVYLGSLIHSSTGSTCDISRRSAVTHAAMQSLENQIWRSRLTISTKLKLYNTCILPIFLYDSDCWAIPKTDALKIDALDQWCLRMLLGIKWYQFVQNDDVIKLTKQPNSLL